MFTTKIEKERKREKEMLVQRVIALIKFDRKK